MLLQSIRDRLTGILAVLVLGILVVPFAFVGINQYFTRSADDVVALVNDQEITRSDFTESFQQYRRRMQSVLGAQFNPEDFDQPLVRRQHLDALINEELLRQAARDAGLSVSDEALAERIRQIPAFQIEGRFDAEVYQNALQAQALSPRQFEQEMRAQMITVQLPAAISASSIATPLERQHAVELLEETRSFRAVRFQPSGEDLADELSEEDIKAWYEANQEQFRAGEQVSIEYVELNAADMAPVTLPDEAGLRGRFEEQQARFINPEQRLASHILVEVPPGADEAERDAARLLAGELAARARAGEDFAELAREYSDDQGSASAGGDLGWIEPGFMVQAFEDALYGLQEDAPISDPVQTSFGWHVIQLRDVEPASGMSFEEARPVLEQEYVEEQSERAFLDAADRLVDIVYEDPTTLATAADELGLEIQAAGPFGRDGGEGIAANPQVVSAAFSDLVLLQGSVSDPVDLGDNHIVMLRLTEHTPSAIRPLDEVRDLVVQQLLEERALEATRERAEALLAQVRDQGTTLEAAAEAAGLDVLAAEDVTRRSGEPSPDLAAAAFEQPRPAEGETHYAVVGADGGWAVLALDEVETGSLPEGSLVSGEQYQWQVANAAASAESAALLERLRQLAEIEVFEDRLRTGS